MAEAAAERGLPHTALAPLVGERAPRIPWDDFLDVLEAFATELGGSTALRTLSPTTFPEITLSQTALAQIVSTRTLFHLGVYWLGPYVFRPTRGELHDLGHGRFLERVEILPGFRSSAAFFDLVYLGISTAPTSIGKPLPEIEMHLGERCAEYVIETADSHTETDSTVLSTNREMPSPPLARPGNRPAPTPFCDRVADEISAQLAVDGATEAQIAARLGMSPRTLKRRLRERGVQFRDLRDRVRHELSLSELAAGRSAEEIASALGYSEVRAFRRAFKRWTGETPRARSEKRPSEGSHAQTADPG